MIDEVRKEATEYSADPEYSGGQFQDTLLKSAVRTAYILGAKHVIKKWEGVLREYVINNADTNKQAKSKLKELGIK
jgi:hypothetical protein